MERLLYAFCSPLRGACVLLWSKIFVLLLFASISFILPLMDLLTRGLFYKRWPYCYPNYSLCNKQLCLLWSHHHSFIHPVHATFSPSLWKMTFFHNLVDFVGSSTQSLSIFGIYIPDYVKIAGSFLPNYTKLQQKVPNFFSKLIYHNEFFSKLIHYNEFLIKIILNF